MRRPVFLVAAAATAGMGLSAGAPAEPAPVPDRGIDVQVPDSKDRIEDYWTRDRMRAATPTPKPLLPCEQPQAPQSDTRDTD